MSSSRASKTAREVYGTTVFHDSLAIFRNWLGDTVELAPPIFAMEIGIVRDNRDQSPISNRSSYWRNSP